MKILYTKDNKTFFMVDVEDITSELVSLLISHCARPVTEKEKTRFFLDYIKRDRA